MKDSRYNPKPRILIAPLEISGYFRSLASGFRELGYECLQLSYRNLGGAFHSDNRGSWPRLVRIGYKLSFRGKAAGRKLGIKNRRVLLGLRAPGEFLIFVWTLWAIARYQVFIFGFGGSLWPWNLDLPVLRFFGKTVISNMSLGSESRPPYMNGALRDDINHELSGSELFKKTRFISRRLAWHQSHCSYVIGSPMSTSQLATKPFINSFLIGTPVSPWKGASPSIEITKVPDVVNVLHAPSRKLTKGTAEIRRIIQRLRGQGYPVRLKILENVSNDDVLRAIRDADLIFDQIHSDIPWPVFSSEAGMLGKCPLFGTLDKSQLQKLTPPDMFPPFAISSSEELEATLELLVKDSRLREKIGNESQKFVLGQLSPVTVAKKYETLFCFNTPKDWFFDPGSACYLFGNGQSAEATALSIRKLVSAKGEKGLMVKNPNLRQELLLLARNGTTRATSE